MSNTTGITPTLLEKGLNEVFYQNYSKLSIGEITSADLFKFSTFDSGISATDLALAGVGKFQILSEDANIRRDVVRERGSTLYEADIYDNGFDISYKMLLADATGRNVIPQAAELGLAGKATQELNRFSVLRNAAVTLGLDGVALIGTHTLATGGTFSNDVATALSYATIKAMILKLQTQLNFQGLPMGEDPKFLVVPPALFAQAIEITQAVNIPGSGNNDSSYISQIFPGLRVGWCPYISAAQGGSDTKFYMFGDSRKLKVFIREAMNTWMNPWQTQNNIVTRYNAKYAEVAGFSDWYGVVRGGN